MKAGRRPWRHQNKGLYLAHVPLRVYCVCITAAGSFEPIILLMTPLGRNAAP